MVCIDESDETQAIKTVEKLWSHLSTAIGQIISN